MTTSAGRKLEQLAGRRPKGQVLQELIERGFRLEEEIKKERRDERKREKAERDNARLGNQRTNVWGREAKQEVAQLKATVAEHETIIDQLLREATSYRAILEGYGLLNEKPDMTQEIIAQENYETLKRRYLKSQKSDPLFPPKPPTESEGP